jgi:Alkylmercury lyase
VSSQPGTPPTDGTANFLAADSTGKRSGLAAGPRAVYQAVLRAFAATGRPPGPAELQDAAQPFGLAARNVLAELAAADYLGLDDAGHIRMAYPFSAQPTQHVVAIAGGPRVYSMCALDALGIPPMLGADAVVTSADPLTGAPVTVTFCAGRASWDPPGAVLYVGRANCTGPAEEVACGYLNFFVSAASAGQWASQHLEVTGSTLNQASAEKLSVEIFGALLGGKA